MVWRAQNRERACEPGYAFVAAGRFIRSGIYQTVLVAAAGTSSLYLKVGTEAPSSLQEEYADTRSQAALDSEPLAVSVSTFNFAHAALRFAA